MGEPKDEPFLDDPEMMDEDAFDLDAAIDEAGGPKAPANLEQIIEERDQMRDQMMRALAEAENVRKRAARDRSEAERYGGSRLARDLLPVYDNLRRAMEAVGEEAVAIREGLELTLSELRTVFQKHGVTVIAPAVGDVFDPQMHEAMFEAPLPGTVSGQIIQVMTEGFLLHDRLLRPAQVGVSSTPVG